MLKPSDRERLQDCLMLVQSARNILSGLPGEPFPESMKSTGVSTMSIAP